MFPYHNTSISKWLLPFPANQQNRNKGEHSNWTSQKNSFNNNNYEPPMLSTLSMTSKAFIRSISKSMKGTEGSLRLVQNISFLLSLIGEWLLLLLSLWCLLNLVLAVSNSWLLLIPGVSFLLPTSRSICWSSIVNKGEVEQPFCVNNCNVFWLGERIGDLTGDLIPPLPTLTWLTRWCSQTTSSSIYSSVLSLSAWCSVSILNKSDWPAGLRLTSDL